MADTTADFETTQRLVGDLETILRLKIQRSKSARLQNRAYLMREHARRSASSSSSSSSNGSLPANKVPAMIPAACCDDLRTGRAVFDCHIHEARTVAGQLFESINGSTVDGKSHLYLSGITNPITAKARDTVVQNERESAILRQRRAENPNVDNDDTQGPIPGDDRHQQQGSAENKAPRTKFVVFCTADTSSKTLNGMLERALVSSAEFTHGTAALALVTDFSLTDTYFAAPNVPGTTLSPPPLVKDMSRDELHRRFAAMLAPLDGRPSFWAAQAYAVFDAQTAADTSTCLLVAETADVDGQPVVERQRAHIDVALPQLVAAEMGTVSLGQQARAAGLESPDAILTPEMIRAQSAENDEWVEDRIKDKLGDEEEEDGRASKK